MTDKEVLLLRRKLDLLLRTGKLLMESAADTNRIERNMKRVAAFMDYVKEKAAHVTKSNVEQGIVAALKDFNIL